MTDLMDYNKLRFRSKGHDNVIDLFENGFENTIAICYSTIFSTCEQFGDKFELACEKNVCLIDPEIIETVSRNPGQFGWTATNYSEFWGRTLSDGVTFRLVL